MEGTEFLRKWRLQEYHGKFYRCEIRDGRWTTTELESESV